MVIIRAHVKKARREIQKVDNERVNPFKIIASFASIKERMDANSAGQIHSDAIDKLVGKYQLDNDDAYSFGCDRQYAIFQSPFQALQWLEANVFFADIGCHHFPYLFNVACVNNITRKYMACVRALLNHQDGHSIGKALLILSQNVKKLKPDYDINIAHKEILLDFDDAEANAFQDSFGKTIFNIMRGCSVHFIFSAMRVAKLVNPSTVSDGYQLFMAIAKQNEFQTSHPRILYRKH